MKVYLYVLDTMADWEYALLMAELNTKRYFSNRQQNLEIITVSHNTHPKTTMGGFKIVPDITVKELSLCEEDYLILPGGEQWFEKENEAILIQAKIHVDFNRSVAAICGATLGLAKYGALDSKYHTSSDKHYLKQICPEYKGESLYKDQLVVNDNKLITATGIAPLEFAYEVIKSLNVFSEETLVNWYGLYEKKEPKYFFGLMKSIQNS